MPLILIAVVGVLLFMAVSKRDEKEEKLSDPPLVEAAPPPPKPTTQRQTQMQAPQDTYSSVLSMVTAVSNGITAIVSAVNRSDDSESGSKSIVESGDK